MRWVQRIVLVALLVLSGWSAARTSRYEGWKNETADAYDHDEGENALDGAQEALAVDDTDQSMWVYLGDAAAHLYRNPPAQGWPDAEAERLAGIAWKGYAGAVLRCPIDSWSWSGLGEIAEREANRRDRGGALDLGEIDRRGEGILTGRFAVALSAARVAVKLQPSGYQQIDTLAGVYEATGELDQAREAYVRSSRMMPAPSFHTWGVGRRLYRGLYDAIVGGLRQGLAEAPRFEKSQLHLDVGRFARAQGDLRGAVEFLTLAKTFAENDYWRFQTSWELGGAYEEEAKFPEALAELQIAYDIGLSRGAVSRRIASIQARLGRFPDACSHFREAVRDEPKDAGLRVEASRSCEESGEMDVAEQLLRDGLENPAQQITLARSLLDFHRRVGRERTADALIRTWRHDFPDEGEFEKWAAETELAPRP